MAEALQGVLPGLLLPPVLFLLLTLSAGLIAWRSAPRAGAVVVLGMMMVLALSTPWGAGWLMTWIEQDIREGEAVSPPQAIIILSAEAARRAGGLDPGPLSLERIRAGARLHRQTGLPVLVSGGLLRGSDESLAEVLARSLREDFGIEARWLEVRSRNTRENAAFSVDMLRRDGIASAFIVTHAWHLPRAQDAFGRLGFAASPAPVRLDLPPAREWTDWAPRPDYLARSWYALRETAGRLVYRLRDGPGE